MRRFEPTDARFVIDLHHAGLHQMGAHVGSGPWDADVEDIQHHYVDSGGEFLVGMLGDELVAMGGILPVADERHCADLCRLRVVEQAQGNGYGTEIVRELEARAIELGFTVLTAHTSTVQVPSQRLLAGSGFFETHRRTVRGPDGQVDAIFYAKDIEAGA